MAGRGGVGLESKADAAAPGAGGAPVLLFDVSKRETHHPNSGFKKLFRRVRANFKCDVNKDEIVLERLKPAALVVFGAPREKFSATEFEAIKTYVNEGGSALFMLGEGGESRYGTNINYLLEQFGIAVNSDSVVRTVYYKYLHPKEVFISNGILNKEIGAAASKLSGRSRSSGPNNLVPATRLLADDAANHGGLDFVYPRGATLNVQKPAVPILSSGYIAYPLNRPVGAVYKHKESGGRLCVLGSVDLFADQWLNKEQNTRLQDVLFSWLVGERAGTGITVELDPVDAEDPDVSEYHYLPDTHALAERLRSCLQESEDLPKDFTQLFDDTLFKFDTNLIPEAVQLYEQLNVKHEPLSLIPPQFETPLPPLQPAVFPPTLRELPPPALDQFDLDEHFASEKIRLAQLTNKCEDDDLEYFISESAEIIGVTGQVDPDKRSPKELLEYIFRRLVDFKKFDQGGGVEDVPGNNQAEELAKIGNSVGVSAGAGGAGAGAGVAGTGGVM